MMTDLVRHRIRLDLLECLRDIAESRGPDDSLQITLEHLCEDLFAFDVRKDKPEAAVDHLLASETERRQIGPLMPELLSLYMAWEWATPTARAYLSPEWPRIQRLCAQAVSLMDTNASAHSLALDERAKEHA